LLPDCGDPKAFREEWLAPNYTNHPEVFPLGFGEGYEMNGHYRSKRQGIVIRRIALRNGEQYQIHPSREWALQHLSGVVLAKVLDLCAKSKLWSVWYDHPDGHTTSHMPEHFTNE
jgi:hypothetical protein